MPHPTYTKTARSLTASTAFRRSLSFTLYLTTLALLISFADSLTPGSLGKHCAFTYLNRFYVLGGTNSGDAPSNGLFYIEAPFQTFTAGWVQQRISNPLAMVGAACSVTSSGLLLVTGGKFISDEPSGVLYMDLTSETPQWTEPKIRMDIANALNGRTNHEQLIYRTSQDDEILFVYGGDRQDLNCMLHIGNMTWEIIPNDGDYAPLVDSQFAMFASKDNVYIVGGINSGNGQTAVTISAFNLIHKFWFDPGTQLPFTFLNGHAAQLNDTVYLVSDERSLQSTKALVWHLPTSSWTTENVGGASDVAYDLYESAQMAGSDAMILYGGYSNVTNKFVSQFTVFNMTQQRMTSHAALVTDAVPDQFLGGPLAPHQLDPFTGHGNPVRPTPTTTTDTHHHGSNKRNIVVGVFVLLFVLGMIILVTAMMVKKKKKHRVRKLPVILPRSIEKGDNGSLIQKRVSPASEKEAPVNVHSYNAFQKSGHDESELSLPAYPLPVKSDSYYNEPGDNLVSSAYPSSVNIDNQLRMNSMGLYHSFKNDTDRDSVGTIASAASVPQPENIALEEDSEPSEYNEESTSSVYSAPPVDSAPPAYESITIPPPTKQPERIVTSTLPSSASSFISADKLSRITFSDDRVKRITYTGSAGANVTPSAPTGTMIFGRYELTGTSAVVGKNAVRRAMDWTVNQTVAIKFFNCRKSYEREVFMLNNLRSRHVAELWTVYEVESTSEYPFITVMSYYPQTLQDVIKSQLTNMDDLYLRLVIKSIANGLQFLHNQGIAHLDLKPGNIARDFGDITSWRLIDFETARFVGEEGVDHCTPSYSSPEVLFAALTKSPVKTRTSMDIWSFGSIIYEMYSLQPLFSEAYTAMERLTEAHRLGRFRIPVENVRDAEAQDVLHKTLIFESSMRATISDILSEPFLNNSYADARLRRDIIRQRRDRPIDWQQITKNSSTGQASANINESVGPVTEDSAKITLSQVNTVMFSIMDPRTADVPRLCALLPGDDSRSITNPAAWNEKTFLLHLLCEGLDRGCRDAHFTEFKGYQISNARPFVSKAGPYLKIVAAVAALKMRMPPIITERIRLFAATPTECFSQIAHAVDEVLAPEARDSGRTRRDPVAHAHAAQKTAQLAIMEFLLLHDPGNELSGLTHVVMPGGLPRWLCDGCRDQIVAAGSADSTYHKSWASYTKF